MLYFVHLVSTKLQRRTPRRKSFHNASSPLRRLRACETNASQNSKRG